MVTKGALANVLAVCSAAETGAGTIVDIAAVRDRIQQHFEEFSSQGFRTLGVAYKNMGTAVAHKQRRRSRHDVPGIPCSF